MSCYNTSVTTNTIKHEVGELKFKSKKADKEDRETWWEHTFDLVFKYCPDAEASDYPAKRFAKSLNEYSCKSFRSETPDIVQTGNVVKARIKMTSRDGDREEAERAAKKAVKSFMDGNHNLLDATFQVSSDEKEKITKYQVWDGVDTYT